MCVSKDTMCYQTIHEWRIFVWFVAVLASATAMTVSDGWWKLVLILTMFGCFARWFALAFYYSEQEHERQTQANLD